MVLGGFFQSRLSKRNVWGHVFEHSSLHPTEEAMEKMKFTYDVLGEKCYLRLVELGQTDSLKPLAKKVTTGFIDDGALCGRQDLYALLQRHASSDTILQDLWTNINDVPAWVDWDQIARGQDCFYRYGGACLIGLAYQSLLAGMGIWMRQGETQDYIALWRYIAYLTGTPTETFETPEKAKRMMEMMLALEMRPSPTSRILASNVISCLQDQPPAFPSRSFIEANARWLNGNELSDELGIGRPSLYYRLLVIGQCLILMTLVYLNRSFAYLDKRKIDTLRHVFWRLVVESKIGLGQEALFEFKHLPDLDKTTVLEGAPTRSEIFARRERRNLFALSFAAIGLVGLWMFALNGRVFKFWNSGWFVT
ncbi:uncharacterized protein KY384_004408 [Bacidia gigantensis]|uniref:uncharacterized protein n=1 Tax=Bacidia gigantensis TaxID=2732470 RepID=UPI001D04E02F|nr:uncharacterized protein KY384_004408 [Bacidia gigantensis]KAG8531051.1 hypothetical protein KY384_004408 [Bacidia gigantensis]